MNVKYIVIHCTGANANQTTKEILNYWKNVKKWKNVGYHFIIDTNGSITQLSPTNKPTNGVKGYNSQSVHICYKGGINVETKKAEDTRTNPQKAALKQLILRMLNFFPDAYVIGHRDLGSYDSNRNGRIDTWERIKECPSFDVYDWLNSINFEQMEKVKKVK